MTETLVNLPNKSFKKFHKCYTIQKNYLAWPLYCRLQKMRFKTYQNFQLHVYTQLRTNGCITWNKFYHWWRWSHGKLRFIISLFEKKTHLNHKFSKPITYKIITHFTTHSKPDTPKFVASNNSWLPSQEVKLLQAEPLGTLIRQNYHIVRQHHKVWKYY